MLDLDAKDFSRGNTSTDQARDKGSLPDGRLKNTLPGNPIDLETVENEPNQRARGLEVAKFSAHFR